MKLFTYAPIVLSLPFIPTLSHASGDDSVETVTVIGSELMSPKVSSSTGLSLTPEETPQSITILDADYIEQRHLSSIDQVLDRVIGIGSLKTDDVRNEFQSRGFEINSYQIDGMPYSWGDTAGFSGQTQIDTAIYERVEVVRGSTGLTTGVGDPSASINLVRKHADSTAPTGRVQASVGSWNTQEVMVDAANALNADGTLRGRVVAKYAQGESYVDLYESKRKVVYAVVEKDLSFNSLLRLGASYQADDRDGAAWGGIPGVYSDGSATHFSRAKTAATDWNFWDTEHLNIFADYEYQFANGWQLKSSYNHTQYSQRAKLTNLNIGTLNQDGSGLYAWSYNNEGDSTQDSISIHLNGDYALAGRQHEFMLGASYSHLKDFNQYYAMDPVAFATVDDYLAWNGNLAEPTWENDKTTEYDFTTQQLAFYTATRVHLSDNTKAILGARIANWQRKGTNYGGVTYGDNGIITPYAGLLYDLSAQSRVYASFATIYEPQNERDRHGDYLDPLEGKTYEIGIKSNLTEQITLSGALFRIEQDNLAQDDTGYTIPNTTNTAQKAVDGTVSKGIEVQLAARPMEGMDINLGMTQFTAEDNEGNDVNTNYARKQVKLSSNYQFVGWNPDLTIGADLRWQSEIHATDDIKQPSYAIVDLMASYQINRDVTMRVNVENLFDKTYYSYLNAANTVRYGAPFNAQLSLNYRF
ncbi:TonB-dependent siderophore receptor [Vibrio furnissii]|uniref:TonB-dependent siderophore receptor n=1 Tax=Vibrio furnissii TaxID=29494 RepID=UPI003D7D26A8